MDNDREAQMELEEIAYQLEQLIGRLQPYAKYSSELEHYIIPQLKIRVGGDHGYMTMDRGIKDVAEEAVESIQYGYEDE